MGLELLGGEEERAVPAAPATGQHWDLVHMGSVLGGEPRPGMGSAGASGPVRPPQVCSPCSPLAEGFRDVCGAVCARASQALPATTTTWDGWGG